MTLHEQTKHFMIGLFVISASAAIVGIVLFLRPGVGDGKETLEVRFSNINQIGVGTRVLFAGKPVGEVVAISPVLDARTGPTDSHGLYYFYQLELKVDSSVKVYSTDQVGIQTSGLLGEKSVAITPRTPPAGVIPKLITTQLIYGDSTDPIENAMNEISDLAGKAEETFRLVNQWIDENKENLSHAVHSFGDAMQEIATAVHEVNRQCLIHEVKISLHNFGNAMHEVDHALSFLRESNAYDNISATLHNLRGASHAFDQIATHVMQGKGSLGRFIEDDDFYLRTNSILSKADTMMNDINHYGLLFHLNKGWQRQRTKRADLLEALRSPQQFQSFFQEEVDQINTSMARLSILVNKAEGSPEKAQILGDSLFREDFAQLMRDVEELADNLKLYNQELSEATKNACICPEETN